MRSKFFAINLKVLFISFVMAVAMWYMIVIGDQVDIQLEVNVEYKNVPTDLIITDGLVSTIDVRLRGPEALLRDIPMSSRTHVVDLAGLHKGNNIIPFVFLGNKALRAFDVQDITPSRIVIIADSVQERNVTIKAKASSSINTSNFKIANIVVTPSNVLLRGPSNTIKNINSIPLKVRIDPKVEPGTYKQVEALDITHSFVSATPMQVEVSYTVLSERKILDLEKNIRIESHQPRNYSISPQNISIKVEMPESLVNNRLYVEGIKLSVTPPLLDVDESTQVPLNVTLPEGVTLVQNLPRVITIKRIR